MFVDNAISIHEPPCPVRLRALRDCVVSRTGDSPFAGDNAMRNPIRHGHDCRGRSTPTYNTWTNMKSRCYNPRHPAYGNYGGRGITVCERWRHSFENFLEDMGVRPDELTIERTDNDKGYCKENCCWANRTHQARNTRQVRLITFDGETHCLSEWAEIVGVCTGTLRYRLKTWTLKEALTTPPLPQYTWRRP